MVYVTVDLRDFFHSYAEQIPEGTVFTCAVVESIDGPTKSGRVYLNMRPPPCLKFAEKAYSLFRVVDRADGTVDMLLCIDKLIISDTH